MIPEFAGVQTVARIGDSLTGLQKNEKANRHCVGRIGGWRKRKLTDSGTLQLHPKKSRSAALQLTLFKAHRRNGQSNLYM